MRDKYKLIISVGSNCGLVGFNTATMTTSSNSTEVY